MHSPSLSDPYAVPLACSPDTVRSEGLPAERRPTSEMFAVDMVAPRPPVYAMVATSVKTTARDQKVRRGDIPTGVT